MGEIVTYPVKDYTWPVCKGCKHRVLRSVHSMYVDVKTRRQEEFSQLAYVCELGLDRDRNPDMCPLKEPEG